MANEEILQEVSLPAGADLSADQFKAVKLSSGNVVLAGAGEHAFILQNKPNNAGKEVTARVALGGRSKCVLGGTVAADDFAAVDASGKFIKAITANLANVDTTTSNAVEPVKGSNIIGQFTSGGVADEIVDLLILNLGLAPGTVQ